MSIRNSSGCGLLLGIKWSRTFGVAGGYPGSAFTDFIPLLAVSELHRSLGLADRREAYPR